mmetsp:Transcript_30861/g.67530  ORF Transcript_30861/g.67530 Transcript_30861/m.67530 type:complete len:293 (-) Transcript_30861:3436-4314(-)
MRGTRLGPSLSVRYRHADRLVDCLQQGSIKIWSEDDATLPHALDRSVRILRTPCLDVVLHQLSKDISDANRALDVMHAQHLLTGLHHLLWVALREFPNARELVNDGDPFLQCLHSDIMLCTSSSCPHHVLQGLPQGPAGLFVVSVLINLDRCTSVIEGRELVVCLRLGVELDDVLHDVWVVMPVEALQVVPGKHVDLSLTCSPGEEDNLLVVAALKEALHRLEFVTCLCELLARQLKGTLLLAELCHPVQDLRSLGRVHTALIGRHSLGHLLSDLHIVLPTEVHGLLELARH